MIIVTLLIKPLISAHEPPSRECPRIISSEGFQAWGRQIVKIGPLDSEIFRSSPCTTLRGLCPDHSPGFSYVLLG